MRPDTQHRGFLSLASARWTVLLGGLLIGAYAVVSLYSLFVPHLFGITAFGDMAQVVAALFAVVGLASGLQSGPKRVRIFWGLMALGCALWMVGQGLWTYFEVVLRVQVPNPFLGDVVLFLHALPMLAALALRPHNARADLNTRLGFVDFALLVQWWVYLYLFVVIPWQYVVPDVLRYGTGYNYLEGLENLLVPLGFGALALRARGPWRFNYAHLFGAALLFGAGAYATNVAIDRNTYYTGSPYDLAIVTAFVWFGIVGRKSAPVTSQHDAPASGLAAAAWTGRLAALAVLSLPLIALWNQVAGQPPHAVRDFRMMVTLATILVFGILVFQRQRMVDQDRLRLLRSSQNALADVQLLQSQIIQTEKLASLGQLAAGAAHEINNPLTGIIGYADLLTDNPALDGQSQEVVQKIRALAYRIKNLVGSLLSFSRQTPSEKKHLDLNGVLSSAMHLNTLDLRGKNIQLEVHTDPELPAVRADANQMMQVFFNVMNNAIDAMEEAGGGHLIIRTMHRDGTVFVEFADTGPGVAAPHLVFDPFFTTKPAGKGAGLGLSICYGIMQEHGGRIQCRNRPEGGAVFLVELPAAQNPGALSAAAPRETAKIS
jgi:signal transduction histidine kinase